MSDLNLDIYSDNFGEWNDESFGDGTWVDTAISLGQKAADASAAKRKAANEAATQAAILANARKQTQNASAQRNQGKQDNTMMYIGIAGVAVVILGVGAYFMMRK